MSGSKDEVCQYMISGCRTILSRYLLEARDSYVDKRLRVRRLYNDTKYHAPVDPYELALVDPSAVTRSMTSFEAPNRKIAGTVVGGSWDRETYDFRDRDGEFHMHVLDSFERRFLEGWDWEETEYYRTLSDRIRDGEDPSLMWGLTTEAGVRDRCEYIDSLFESMRDSGYKTQAELAADDRDPTAPHSRRESYRKINGEIAVNIDRNGEYVFYDGRHRLALAKILEIETVPAVILVRHRHWQRIRDELSSENVTHPSGNLSCHADIPAEANS